MPEPDSLPRPKSEGDSTFWAWRQASDDLLSLCRAVASGEVPVEKMPPPCHKALEQARSVMLRILAATHAETGGLPGGTGFLGEYSSQEPSTSDVLEYMVTLAALETRLQLTEGHAEQAVDLCLDTLALARELAFGGGLNGDRRYVDGVALTYRSCAGALDETSVERKRHALEQLTRVSQGLPRFSALLREESILHQLIYFGSSMLPREAISRLPPASRPLVAVPSSVLFHTIVGDSPPLLRQHVWRRNVSLFDAMVKAADLPRDERLKAFTRIEADYALLSKDPNAAHAMEYQRRIEKLDSSRIQAAMLIALVQVDIARKEQGHWPATLPLDIAALLSLDVRSEEEAVLTPREAAFAMYALSISADGARPPPTLERSQEP